MHWQRRKWTRAVPAEVDGIKRLRENTYFKFLPSDPRMCILADEGESQKSEGLKSNLLLRITRHRKEIVVKEILSVLAGILFIVGFVPYIRAIVRKETKPAKASWIIWASLDSITIAGMYAKDAVNGQIVGACLGAWVVVIF